MKFDAEGDSDVPVSFYLFLFHGLRSKPLRNSVCEDRFLTLLLDKICPGALIMTEHLNNLVYEWCTSRFRGCCLRSKLFPRLPNKEVVGIVVLLYLLL